MTATASPAQQPRPAGQPEPAAAHRSGIRAVGGSAGATLRRALELSPELRHGLLLTLGLAAVATLGRLAVPVTVQRTVDDALLTGGGPDVPRATAFVVGAAVVVLLTACCGYLVNSRLFRATEAGLATLRRRAFEHVHSLAVLTQDAERRGSLVSRVTSDVDTISQFLQTGGLVLLLSVGQLAAATVVMAVYSVPLTLLVWACYGPLLLVAPRLQRRLSAAYALVRERMGDLLAVVSEAVVGADTIRAHAASERTWRRLDAAVEAHRRQAVRAQLLAASAFSGGVLVSGLVLAAVVLVGTQLGMAGDITLGRLLAFLFIVQLFTGPVAIITEVLNELQNALAGWRRVIAVLDTPADVADPGDAGLDLPPGPVDVTLEGVSFTYPGGREALRGVDLHLPAGARVAVVGETGSGKTTLSRIITRLVDPTTGRVLLSGTDARDLRPAAMHRRVVAVPQEGFLFDTTVAANVRLGQQGATDADAARALADLGLSDWVATLPEGLHTEVGQRGDHLSAGERQLVALARAHLAAPDLLVLDEATSAVDPATEVRLQRALAVLLTGRTSIAIAHRLATAEAADVVVVVERGEVVEVGRAAELAAAGGTYARLHAAWVAQHRDEG